MLRACAVILASSLVSVGCDEAKPTDVPPSTPDAAAPAPVPSQCDAGKVAALADTLDALDARAQRNAIAEGLREGCTLPAVIDGYLVLARRGRAGVAAERAKWGTEAERHAAEQAACPGAAELMAQLAEAPAEERAGLLYDRCKLERFALIGRTEFARLRAPSTIPFYATTWLEQQGVPAAQVQTIARALMLVQQVDYQVSSLRLPTVEHAVAPVPEGVLVHITEFHVEFGDRRVAVLGKGAIYAGELKGELVVPLRDVLTQEAERRGQAGGTGQDAPTDRLLLAADAELPFRVVSDVLYTATESGLSDLRLVVESAPLQFGTVPLSCAKRPRPDAPPPPLAIRMDERGFTLRYDHKNTSVDRAGGTWDLAGLGEQVAKFKAEHASAVPAELTITDAVPYGRAVAAIATLRGPQCEATGACWFEDVQLRTQPTPFDPDLAARDAGMVGIMGDKSGGHFLATPYGDTLSDGDDEEIWGGLKGTEIGEAFGGSGTRVPSVRMLPAKVKGNLDKDIIRGIIAAHINEVRFCYNQGLVDDATLAGKLTVAFTIGTDGKVTASKVAATTLADEAVGTCTAKAVARWSFPRPTSGEVTVTFPFALDPGSAP